LLVRLPELLLGVVGWGAYYEEALISFLLVPVEAMFSFLDVLNLSELKKVVVLVESRTLPPDVFLRAPKRFIFIFYRLVPSK
jgi:hypothetical protein